MLKHAQITRDRVRQFIAHELLEKLVKATAPAATQFLPGEYKSDEEARGAKSWSAIQKGFKWGPAFAEGWYRVTADVPEGWKGQVVLTYDENLIGFGQGKLLDVRAPMVEGTIWQGGTTVGGLDYGHTYYRLGPGTTRVDLCVQTYAHNKESTVHRPEQPRTAQPEDFHGFLVALIDDDLLQLYYDCWCAHNLLEVLPEDEVAYATILRALNDVCNAFVTGRPRNLGPIRKHIKAAYDSLNLEQKHVVTAVGHAHLDTAWLWPLAVTKLKMLHTSTVQLELLERYPDYVYVHSQASQYEWLEQQYPHVFERVQKAIKKGSWEPVGSMWVEADCNLTGGESLVRQFLYGRRYFRQKMGVTTEDMWLPDVFGYSAALPQILKKFNISYFLTQKLSWNQFNKLPHNTFWWQGIDGTKVWSHFPPSDTYVGDCSPAEIAKSVKKHRDHGRSDRSLYAFGFGDGGGGPTEMHVERLRRARLAPQLPDIEVKGKAIKYFQQAFEESQDLCTWVGELYFETHRGTYTTQAANKAANRRAEMALRDAEWLSCFAPGTYPKAELEDLWKVALLNQFHDIIPGSSIREVYEDSAKDYAELDSKTTALVEGKIKDIASRLDTSKMTRPIALFHNANASMEGRIAWDEDWVPGSVSSDGEVLPVQEVNDLYGRGLVFAVPMAARGAVAIGDLTDRSAPPTERLKIGSRRMENDEWVVKFDSQGNIGSIQALDDHPIEFIQPGRVANLFQVLDDKPLFWDAWDTDIFAQEVVQDLVKSESFEVVERGPVRVAVEVVKKFGASTIRQRISLGPTPGIRFDTEVDWREDHKLLKVAFPLNVHTDQASFDIQFGHVKRPTHRNTTWDVARFEVCCQKWIDLSEGGYGAALINQGKYGCDVSGNVVRLSLLKSPKAPDPQADMGIHRFSYVLFPHFDQVASGRVVPTSYAINARPWIMPVAAVAGARSQLLPFVRCTNRNVVIETVKQAEDSNHLVVRLYECHNARGRGSIVLPEPVKRAWICDLEETIISEAEVQGTNVSFDFNPFEIVTLLVER